MNILIAEDSKLVVEIILKALKRGNYNFTICRNGSEAIEQIEKEQPDLVLSDIMMPLVSGLELTRWIRENYQDKIKIILLTSLGNEDVVLQSFALGVDDFITKPIKVDDLYLRVERFNHN
jgi:CheY-like chemotaxis protein